MSFMVVAVEPREDRPSSLRVSKVVPCADTVAVAAAISDAAGKGREWAVFELVEDGSAVRVSVVLLLDGDRIADVEVARDGT